MERSVAIKCSKIITKIVNSAEYSQVMGSSELGRISEAELSAELLVSLLC